MKIIARLSFLVLVPVIVGLALVLSGYSAGAWVLAFGVPGVMIILVIAGLIMMMKGKLFDNGKNQKEQGIATGEVNRFEYAEYEAAQITEGTKNASKKGMAAVIIIIVLLLADVALAVTFTILNIWVGAIVCAALFGATVVSGLLTAVIAEKLSLNGDVSKAKRTADGEVKSCVVSSTVSAERSRNPAVVIKSAVYRVTVSADGEEYVAFSKRFYNAGEKVTVAIMGRKRAVITETDTQKSEE